MAKKFTPLAFLAALGAGGIAVMPFVLFQYTIAHDAGLITRAQLWANVSGGIQTPFYLALEGVMVVFALLHVVLSVYFARHLVAWLKTPESHVFAHDPVKNGALLAPLISLLMTMNLLIGPVRYFLPVLSDNFQSLFLPAMVFWSALFVGALWLEIYLLGVAFKKKFDADALSFGWLLHPFMLGMLTTVGTGIAAMSKDPSIAHTAAFMSMISGTMGVFLLVLKLGILFKARFDADGLPAKSFLPSFLIVIPNITLFAISAFRFGHFLEHHHGFHMDAYFYLVIGLAFAFEVWYLLFGFMLLGEYFKRHHFMEFYVTQWGLVCPLVAFVVLGAFVYAVVWPSAVLYGILVFVLALTIALYVELLYKHVACVRGNGAECE